MALLAQFRVVSCEQIKYWNIRLQTWLQLQGQWRLTLGLPYARHWLDKC